METELIKALNSVLKEFPQFWDGEKLHRSLVIDAINQKEPTLIKALINNDKIKENYSSEIDGVLLFDFEKLISLLKYKEFWYDSFTKYRNTIGLTSEGKYLNYNSDVVLDFPFKDCVLEGGMTKEDQGKDEIYYNEVIARDEIDRLFAPKVLTKTKRYTKESIEENITDFSDEDNLIIKGNNLIALHSLKERYAGKVKLIYIDPPFNTGKDEFKYNDRFNHSTWLTFMKNRLEIARQLLNDEGILVVHVGNEESAYTHVLLDEILGRENFINHITITTNAPSGFKATSSKIFSTSNHLYVYSKNILKAGINKVFIEKGYDDAYKYFLLNPEDSYKEWKYVNVSDYVAHQQGFNSAKEWRKEVSKFEISEKIATFCNQNNEQVFRTASISGGALQKRKETVELSKKNRNIVYQHPNEDISNFYILNGEQIVFWANCFERIDNEIKPAQILTDVWTDISFTGIANEGKVTLKNAKKPEKLLKRVIELFSNPNDIVLDYHLGSGTACAVAHKMNRRYIGVEQLDYAENSPWIRLNNVINGDTTGISKDVEWQGGGSFVYVELMELNYRFIHEIEKAQDYEALTSILEEMKVNAHLNYHADLNKVLKTAYEMDGMPRLVSFDELELHEQKKLLIELLDKNQLYVSLSEINDKTLHISDADKAFNHRFYEKD